MQKKVAIFDIDKTIIRKDSMLLFVWYGIKKRPLTLLNLIKIGTSTVLYKLQLMKVEKVKATYYYAISFLEEADLKEFYTSYWCKIFIRSTKRIEGKKGERMMPAVVSASPHAYVKYFKKLPYVRKNNRNQSNPATWALDRSHPDGTSARRTARRRRDRSARSTGAWAPGARSARPSATAWRGRRSPR